MILAGNNHAVRLSANKKGVCADVSRVNLWKAVTGRDQPKVEKRTVERGRGEGERGETTRRGVQENKERGKSRLKYHHLVMWFRS